MKKYVEKIDIFIRHENMPVMSKLDPLHVLQEVGLPEKAASLYFTLLNKKRMTIAELARESGVKRATCYEYLD